MNALSFSLLMAGVLLNAGAQLLLKAGTNVLGVLTLTRENWTDTLARMATESHFVLGAVCYAASLVVWILGLSRVPVSIRSANAFPCSFNEARIAASRCAWTAATSSASCPRMACR